MDRTVVFRVEDAEGYGPYRGASMELLDAHNGDPKNHPTRWNDKGLKHRSDTFWPDGAVRFGFQSMRRMCEWFTPEELNALFEMGFRIAIYKMPQDAAAHGDKQTIFKCAEAERVRLFQFRPLKRGQHVQSLELF